MQVLARAAELTSAGHHVVHFEVGEPDFPTAQPIVAAGQAALAAGKTKYTQATGIPELRSSISDFYAAIDCEIAPERICVTSGASAGLTLLAALLLDVGDELLITDPGYPCNEVFARLVGGVPKPLPVSAETRFQPELEGLQACWSKDTKAALLASPANPTGTMLAAATLRELANFIEGRGGVLIVDEIYQGLVENPEYRSALQLTNNLYVLNSFSKYFGMTGWRLGWIVVPEAAVENVTKLAQNLFISPSTPAQYAALAAFSEPALEIHEARVNIFRSRSKLLLQGLQELGFTIPVPPDGAFYLYVDVSHTGLSGADFCWRLLDEYHVAVTPGDDFGTHQSDRYVRFAFTTDEQSIELGLQRIARALHEWGIV